MSRLIMMFWMRSSAVSPSPVILVALVHLGSRRCARPCSHCIYVLCQQSILYVDHPTRGTVTCVPSLVAALLSQEHTWGLQGAHVVLSSLHPIFCSSPWRRLLLLGLLVHRILDCVLVLKSSCSSKILLPALDESSFPLPS